MPLRFAEDNPNGYRYPLLIGKLFATAMAGDTGGEIVYRDRVRLDYPKFGERVYRLAAMLAGLGVEQGTTVAVMDWDSHRYLECYFAVPMMGAVLQTVNVRLSADQIAYTLASSGAELLLVHRDFADLARDLLVRTPAIRACILIGDGEAGAPDVPCVGEYEAMLAASAPVFSFEDFDENAIATTFHTTGTTGLPKAVTFSHRQLALHSLTLMAVFGAQPDGQGFRHGDVYMPLTPMFHVHAWGFPFAATMMHAKQVYPGRYEPDMICRLKREEGVTFSHCVPTVLQMILDGADASGLDIDGWKMVIGGSAMSRSLHEAAGLRGITTMSGYGMSETGPIVAVARHGGDIQSADRTVALCRAGLPPPLVEARIVDPDMRTLPTDGVAQGELVLRAPWLTPAYVGGAEASAELWRGGWLHTQDVATIDPDGGVTIRDRLKDVIKTGGEWVSSVQLEDLTTRHPAIAEAAYLGVPDAKWGERPVAVLVAAPGEAAAVTLAAVRAHLAPFVESGAISRYALPDRILLVDALPRTSVGKIDKKAIRATLAAV